ncbi:conserved hypothetical protein [Histoplasma capsulatum var. duboisii H88]|uniref:Uncharacterized protein n=1 Tax=Ajellomyces capsulatus (strain H88) TaxID=544711 RepID=F0UVK0_AJEC8|nr:conserved hypothetical protein [Histoplasma capsulatum var. duboisii H88]
MGVSGEIQEAYQSATHLDEFQGSSHSLSEHQLKYLFSGAPHFLLEKGLNRWYPHVVFPWDRDLRIQHLDDRKALEHPSFTLSTLHAHIPVSPGGGGIQIYPDALTEKSGCRRPSFDIGVFEVPNMLSSRANEDGCIGFHNFMELPIVYGPRSEQRPLSPRLFDKHLQITPAPRGKDDPYSDYNLNVIFDRLKLVAAGPSAWKRIGVRDCSMKAITQRLQTLSGVQDQITLQGKSVTLLDEESVAGLHRQLFSTFLYPPPNAVHAEHPDSFRFQISTLIQVLNLKGAWVDFSLMKWRVRAGQILWELPPHQDSDCLQNASDGQYSGTALQRKWLLLQVVLSAEVLFRADAAATKIGIYSQSKDLPITPRDVSLMNSLRSDMLDWGLIFCCRIFENISFHYWPQASHQLPGKRSLNDLPKKTHSIVSVPKVQEPHDLDSPWVCALLPRYPRQQLEALLVFAELLKWPDIENMKHYMREKLEFALLQPSNFNHMFASPMSTVLLSDNIKLLRKCEMYRKSHSLKLCRLHSCPSSARHSANYVGGWMSRQSWWSKACVIGRILASFDASTICMGWISTTIIPLDDARAPLSDGWLEIETIDITKTHTQARINQGKGVLLDSSPLGTEGDLSATAFSLPLDEANAGPSQDTQVLYENTILSLQHSQHPSVTARPPKATATLAFTLTHGLSGPSQVSMSIKYNVSFVSAFPCLPPYGSVLSSGYEERDASHQYTKGLSTKKETNYIGLQKNRTSRKSKPTPRPRLPGHLLHTASFPYSYIPIHTLPSTPRLPTTPNHLEAHTSSSPVNHPPLATNRSPKLEGSQRKHTYVVDARGSEHKELFARSWCAMVGVDAVVGRVGQTCVACCIREARAADVPVVIRVGMAELSGRH